MGDRIWHQQGLWHWCCRSLTLLLLINFAPETSAYSPSKLYQLLQVSTQDSNQEAIAFEAVSLSSAEQLVREGEALRSQEDGTGVALRAAIDKFERALAIFQISRDRDIEQQVSTLRLLGESYFSTLKPSLNDPEYALIHFHEALVLSESLEPGKREINKQELFIEIGRASETLGRYQDALNSYNQAVAQIENLEETVFPTLPNWLQAETNWQSVLLMVVCENSLEVDLGRWNDDLDALCVVLSSVRANSVIALVDKSSVYAGLLNDFDQAIATLKLAQEMANSRPSVGLGSNSEIANFLEGVINHTFGQVYVQLEDFRESLKHHTQALNHLLKLEDQEDFAGLVALQIAQDYIALKDEQQAARFLDEGIRLARQSQSQLNLAQTLSVVGNLQSRQGNYESALETYQEALNVARSLGNLNSQMSILHGIAKVYLSSEDWDANTSRESLTYAEEFLELAQLGRDPTAEVWAQFTLAQIHYLILDNPLEALEYIDESTRIIESLRIPANLNSLDLRTSFFSEMQDSYQLHIDILTHLSRQNPSYSYKAFNISERSRSRTLTDLLAESNVNFSEEINDPVLKGLLENEQNLGYQLEAQYNLLNNASDENRVNEIEAEIQRIDAELDRLESEIRNKHPSYGNLKYPEPLNLEQVQDEVLDENTLLLQYSLGTQRSYLFTATKDGMTVHELPGRQEIEVAANNFYTSLKQNRTASDITLLGNCLNQLILPPEVAEQFSGRKLLIAADGILHYVPFAALPLPSSNLNGQPANQDSCNNESNLLSNAQSSSPPDASDYIPLISAHQVINIPSVTAVHALRQQSREQNQLATKTIAVLADPVFSDTDPRITNQGEPVICRDVSQVSTEMGTGSGLQFDLATALRSVGGNLNRLPCTRLEAEQILGYIADPEQATAVFDWNATQDWVMESPLDQYRIVLFATHGLIDNNNPELSGLVLSRFNQQGQAIDDAFLRFNEIFNLDLSADLVVLSACETGLGENVRGEGIIGLTRGFMYAGAERVAVSLWKVEDSSTANLMTTFHQKILVEELNPAEALQQAQVEMWRAGKNPYHWAAFVLQGEWRD